jgi:hypothetical protein
MNQINGVHVFSTGSHQGSGGPGATRTWTEADLDSICTTFNEAAQAGRVPLKFGHNEEQAVTDGQPALGWVGKLWREGSKLMADFMDIPTAVYAMIKAGLYKFTSIELLKDAEHLGKKFPWMLDAVALLGADPPAVTGLADLQKLTLSRNSVKFVEALSFKRGYSYQRSGDLDNMDAKELQTAIAAALAPINDKVTALGTELSTVKTERDTFKADNAKLVAQNAEAEKVSRGEKIKMKRENIVQILEAATRAGKITPAQRERFIKRRKLDSDDAVFAIDVKEIEEDCEITQAEAVKLMISGKSAFSREPGKGDGSMAGASNGKGGDFTAFSAAKIVRDRVKASGGKLDPFAALEQELQQNPEMADALLAGTFETAEVSV